MAIRLKNTSSFLTTSYEEHFHTKVKEEYISVFIHVCKILAIGIGTKAICEMLVKLTRSRLYYNMDNLMLSDCDHDFGK